MSSDTRWTKALDLSSIQEWRMLVIRYEGRDSTPEELAKKYKLRKDEASALFAELETKLKVLKIIPKVKK